MSAFAAFYNLDGSPVDPAVLRAANACVAHRCPDGAWSWAGPGVGLTQADLATLPEDRPGSPVARGPFRIAAGCRIDNRDELRAALPAGAVSPKAPDAAYILAAYDAWGDACAGRLVGDFAFVIWDGHRRRLFAARDCSGVRQLFYYRDHSRVIIAADRTQIIQDPAVPFAVDEEQLLTFLTPSFQYASGWDQGLLRGLCALPAGHTLHVEGRRLEVRRFWEWRGEPVTPRVEGEVLDGYRHHLEQAVADRLRSRQGHLAVELSGGLDSPAIAALAARRLPPDAALHSLSVVFPEVPEADERERILATATRYGLTPHFVAGDDAYAPLFLEPGWAPAALLAPQELLSLPLALARLYGDAEASGCRVVLTGQMGDSLNDGSPAVYFDLLRRGRPAEAARRLRAAWRRSPRAALGTLARDGLAPLLLPAPLLRAARARAALAAGMPDDLPDYLTPRARARITELDRAIRADRARRAELRCPAALATWAELSIPMAACTMPFQQPLEHRHPYTDRRLVEFVLAMPQALKWDPAYEHPIEAGRWHHRRALRGIVPDAVLLDNPGMYFTEVVERSLRPARLAAWLAGGPSLLVIEHGYVTADGLARAVRSPANQSYYLRAVLALEAWLRAYTPAGARGRLGPTPQGAARLAAPASAPALPAKLGASVAPDG